MSPAFPHWTGRLSENSLRMGAGLLPPWTMYPRLGERTAVKPPALWPHSANRTRSTVLGHLPSPSRSPAVPFQESACSFCTPSPSLHPQPLPVPPPASPCTPQLLHALPSPSLNPPVPPCTSSDPSLPLFQPLPALPAPPLPPNSSLNPQPRSSSSPLSTQVPDPGPSLPYAPAPSRLNYGELPLPRAPAARGVVSP